MRRIGRARIIRKVYIESDTIMLHHTLSHHITPHRIHSHHHIGVGSDEGPVGEETRKLGLVVCRGTTVVMICPQDGMKVIENPFA